MTEIRVTNQWDGTARLLRTCSAFFVGAACFTLAPVAVAQSTADDMARRHFESATAYMDQADYEGALREFKKAFELSSRPEMLINVATAEERLGDLAATVATLSRYLELDPSGERAETVRIRLANLKARLEAKRGAETQAAATAPEPTAAPATKPAPTPANEAAPSPYRLPGWILIGVAGASAVGAGITGAIALAEHSDAKDSCSPGCTDSQLSAGRTMSLTSTVLTGVAVVAGGVGVVLLLSGGGSDEGQKASVALGVRGTVGQGMATATVGF
jgi:hypothetical protein